MDFDPRSLKHIRIARPELLARLAAVLMIFGIAGATYLVIDRESSDTSSIETIDSDLPDPSASEDVGGDNLAAPEPLAVGGTLDTTGPDGSSPDSSQDGDELDSGAGSQLDQDVGSEITEDQTPPTSAGAPSANPTSPPADQTGGGQASTPSSVPGDGGGAGSTTDQTAAPGQVATDPAGTTPAPTPGSSGQVVAAVIPFVSNGIGDGATGGRQPWTPPAAAINFDDVGDRSATTVQANCTSSNDCGAEIKRIINTNSARPLKITFGDGSRRGARFNMRSPVVLRSDITIEGINQPTLVVSSGSILFNVSGTANVSIRNFDMDMQSCSGNSNAVVAAVSPVENLFVSGINVSNAAPNTNGFCENDFVRLSRDGSGQNIHVYNNQVDRLRRLVRVQADIDTIRVLNNRVTEIGKEGYTQSAQGTSRNVYIEGNVFSRHAPNAKAGHLIGFPLSKAAEPRTYARNVSVRNNLVEGRPNTPHIRVEGQTGGTGLPNGGAGDLIAMRGIDGFIVEGNMIRHSGEVGLTATAGLKNGVIRYNQVSYTDTTGIVLGNEARNSNERVSNVDVYRNEMFQNSLDRAREFTDRDHPTFSLWNTVDSCIVNNYIHHNSNSNGFWVWNGNNSTWPASVFDVYINGNRFEANKRDFVEAPGQTPPYSEASPSGGENWTSFFDSAVDRDNDGLPGRCGSESNDNDPCVPDRFAEACRQ